MAKFIQYMTHASLYDGPFDADAGWTAAGMGNIIVTENGRLIIIDGGFPNDAEDFVKLLEAQTNTKTPKIDYWIISHPHLDHYGAIKGISEDSELKKRITVNKLVYWFPDDFCGGNGEANSLAKENHEMLKVCELLGAEYHQPKRNEILALDDIDLEFLYVPDDCSILNTAGGNSNFCSLIFTVKGKDKKAMVTGDAYERSMQITAWRYANKLKCDILQMPHHALCDSYCVDFYRYTDPQVVLMPISAAGYRAMHSKLYERHEGGIANLCVESKANIVYKAFEGTVELMI